jgi:uncharacterized membrane protein
VRRRLSLIALVFVLLSWDAALVAAPSTGATHLASLTYLAGSLVCHQQPDRSFHRGGAQYPVCARCLGLYVGAIAGAIGWVVLAGVRPTPAPRAVALLRGNVARRALIVTGVPTLISVALGSLGVWDGSNVVRAALAVPLGAAIAAVTSAVLAGDLR